MDNMWVRHFVLFLFILAIQYGARRARHRFAKPKTTDGVQKPGGFDRFLVNLITGLAIFSGLFSLLGLVMSETEMAIVFAVLTLVFTGITFWLRSEYKMTYEEHADHFIYQVKKKDYKVFYDDIIDWSPGHNELLLYDQTNPEEKFIPVNIAVFKPEILLRKMADMTFAGHFFGTTTGTGPTDDPYRKYELINFLIANNYGYLVEDYIEELEK